ALRSAVARRFGLFTGHISRFIVISEFAREWIVRDAGVSAERVDVNPCAINLPGAPVEDPSRGGYVAFAGRLVEEKGVDNLLEACRTANLPVRVSTRAAESYAAPAGVDVSFDVSATREALSAFYRGARVLAVPSIWWETFGIVAAEASSHGVPVVASRIGALS